MTEAEYLVVYASAQVESAQKLLEAAMHNLESGLEEDQVEHRMLREAYVITRALANSLRKGMETLVGVKVGEDVSDA